MPLQAPFFGKKEPDRATGHARPSPTATPSAALGAGKTSGPAFGAPTAMVPAGLNAAAAQKGNTANASANATLTVGAHIKLKGVEITDCDTLVVEGAVEAAIKARVIQIAPQGIFKGSAEVEEADVHGSYDGQLTVHQRLTVRATGKVTGTVRYGALVVAEGGQLSGEVHAGAASASDAAPTPATTTAPAAPRA